MGTQYQYTCESCTYGARVSGGRDMGMLAVVRTMFCRGCSELVDVLIGQCGLDGPTGDRDYDKDLGICRECHGKDLVVWVDGAPCPRCDGRMVIGEDVLMWD
jgi:hypothetical protein